ncbi:MAG: hypothetical protein GY722_17280, partial [bacterium]|nr:hypothetical protein [bacterium]
MVRILSTEKLWQVLSVAALALALALAAGCRQGDVEHGELPLSEAEPETIEAKALRLAQ